MTLTPASPFNAHLTAHFRLGEFALNDPRRRFREQHQLDTALLLATFLEGVRTKYGAPVIITSGYRPSAINAAVGGARFSEHLYNRPGTGAVDFYVWGASMPEVERWCDRVWDGSLGLAAARRGFIHLGLRSGVSRARWTY